MKLQRGPVVGVVAALVVLVGSQLFPGSMPLGVILMGALLGTGTGLMAVGLVLTYRTTRIINFSYGAMGSAGAGVAAGLALGKGWSWVIAGPVGVAVGIAIGALVERFVIRRFATAPRLVLTVATVGLAQALGGAAIFLPDLLGGQPIVSSLTTPLTRHKFEFDPVLFNGNDLALLAVVPVVLAALTWFLLRTEAGIAVRGMADNMDRARLLGIPVNRLSMLLWSIAGGLAALTVTMRVPNEGIALDVTSGPTVLLPALAAAVVTGMTSLSGAFVAGVAIGVLDQLVRWNVERQATTYLVLLAVIVVGLLVQRSLGAKARGGSEESSWSVVGTGHALPAKLAGLPEVRVAKWVLGGLLALFVVIVPFVGSTSQVNYVTVTLVYGMVAVSLVVLTGWGGVVSLGQVAIVGVGGVVAANLIADQNLDLFVTLLLAGAAGGVIALLLGLPALRVSGQFLAVTTLAFAVAMQLYFLNPANYESLLPSSYSRPEVFGVGKLVDERGLYALALSLLVASLVVVANLRRARTGRVIAAARDNDRAAAATGVNTVETRLMAFVFSGVLAGLAGAIHAIALRGVGFNTYEAADSLLVFSMAVIGGVASLGGTLAGVALVQWLGYSFPKFQLLLTGVGLLAILMVIPGGLGQAAERLRDAYARAIARARGISLVEQFDTVDEYDQPEPPPAVVDVGDWDTPAEGIDTTERPAPVGGWGPALGGPGHMDLDRFGHPGPGTEAPPAAAAGVANGAGRSPTARPGGPGRGWGQEPPGYDDGFDGSGEGLQPVPAPNGWTTPSPNHTPGPDGYGPGPGPDEGRWGSEPAPAPAAPAAPGAPGAGRSNGQRPVAPSGPTPPAPPGRPSGPRHAAGGERPVPAGSPAFRAGSGPGGPPVPPPPGAGSGAGRRDPQPPPGYTTAPDSGRPLLTADGVQASYGSLQVLFGIDAGIGEHEMVALLGTNGAGKSTLLKAVSGLLPPNKGKVVFDGKDITSLPAEKIAQLGLSLMPGGKGIFPSLTVAENLRLACWMLRHDRRRAREGLEDVLTMFPILHDRWDQQAGNLSGGEQQQLSLAMAFVTKPKLLCIDELSLGLAPTIVGQLVEKVKEMHAQGTTIVVVEQSINVALLLCERALFLEKGQVRFRGPTAGLLDRPEILRAVFIGAGEGTVTAPTALVPPEQRNNRGLRLECRQLTKRFGGIRAVDAVDLVVEPGHIVGLIGHNGAGKTTLFDLLTGFLPADGGQVLLNGVDITAKPPYKRARLELGRSFQEARLFPSLSVVDALRVSLERHLDNRDPVAAGLRLPASTDSERAATERADELVELLGLTSYRDRLTGELSTGTRRIVELGCLLGQNPAIILLDEPSAGVAQKETEALGRCSGGSRRSPVARWW